MVACKSHHQAALRLEAGSMQTVDGRLGMFHVTRSFGGVLDLGSRTRQAANRTWRDR